MAGKQNRIRLQFTPKFDATPWSWFPARPVNRRDHRWARHLRLELEATGVKQDHIDRGEGEELISEE
jgi:hypothetical protein